MGASISLSLLGCPPAAGTGAGAGEEAGTVATVHSGDAITGTAGALRITGEAEAEPRRMHKCMSSDSILNSVKSFSDMSLTMFLISSNFIFPSCFLGFYFFSCLDFI
jgi:hypothetical protein